MEQLNRELELRTTRIEETSTNTLDVTALYTHDHNQNAFNRYVCGPARDLGRQETSADQAESGQSINSHRSCSSGLGRT
jgi:hypothetical protein